MTNRFLVSVSRTLTPRLIGVAFILAVGLAAFAGASLVAAQRGDPGEQPGPAAYQGCVNTHTGALRIVDDGQSCQDHETAIELGSGGADAALLERMEAFEAENSVLRSKVDALEQENAGRIQEISHLEGEVSKLEDAQTALELQLPACLSTSGTEVYFIGCNIHIRSGSGSTEGAINSLGNLIIGYNENDDDTRTGSHNLVIGSQHSYSSYGGLVAGSDNEISGLYSSVWGGTGNTASGDYSSVRGGTGNTTSGDYSSVYGGTHNTASGDYGNVSGGNTNTASGDFSSVSGGRINTASGDWSSISGGESNTASAISSSVMGGTKNLASGDYSSVSGGRNNTANGDSGSISGGYFNETRGSWSSVSGGYLNTAIGSGSSIGGKTGQDATGVNQFLPQP